jgi:hypothetical protein
MEGIFAEHFVLRVRHALHFGWYVAVELPAALGAMDRKAIQRSALRRTAFLKLLELPRARFRLHLLKQTTPARPGAKSRSISTSHPDWSRSASLWREPGETTCSRRLSSSPRRQLCYQLRHHCVDIRAVGLGPPSVAVIVRFRNASGLKGVDLLHPSLCTFERIP